MIVIADSFLTYYSPTGGVFFADSTEVVETYFDTIIYPAAFSENELLEKLNEHGGEDNTVVLAGIIRKSDVDLDSLILVADGLYRLQTKQGTDLHYNGHL